MEQKKLYSKTLVEKIISENNDEFECLIIKPGSIKSVSWFDSNYSSNLMNLYLFNTVKTNTDKFVETIVNNLELAKYNIKNLNVKNEIVGEEPYYLFELCYVDLENSKEYQKEENLNEMASLINVNGELIYSNAILFRSHIPSLSDSMTMCSATKADLQRLLYERVHTGIVLYDEGIWSEKRVSGDLTEFAEIFFDDKYEKIELPFLMHNINIWYSTSDSGDFNTCGNLLDEQVDKCIIFSMKSEEFRGNITLDEVKKIIYLSKVLTNYQTPSELLEEKTDNYGRKIIYNKYKVLDYTFNKYQK